jgi:methylase of polypeptide subunit release factors
MIRRRTAYELSQSQVSTPPSVVQQLWRLVHARRGTIGSVLDLGAGDCRFAVGGHFRQYTGIEIDPSRISRSTLPKNARVINQCAFRHQQSGYDACVGNPPYVRHHDLESPWRDDVIKVLEKRLGVSLNKRSNLFLYFLCLALLKTTSDGIVALVVPFEWISRPSAEPVRDFIREQGWDVDIYRFTESVFDKVLTTSSITILDKKSKGRQWLRDITAC